MPLPGAPSDSGSPLADLFGGVNRPQLNAFVANSQARNGLVSAQTQDAIIKAQQAQEDMEAHDRLPQELIDANPGMKQSEAMLARDLLVHVAGGSENALKVLGSLKAGYGQTPAEQLQGQTLATGKPPGPETIPGNYVMPPTSPYANLPVQQNPESQAQTQNYQQEAALHQHQATAPTASSLTDDAAYNAAVKYNQWGIMPSLGMGASAAADRKKILDFAAQQSHDPNWTPPSWAQGGQGAPPPQVPGPAAPGPVAPPQPQHPTLQQATNTAANPADMKAQAAMLTDQTKRTANADASEQTALKQMDIVRKVLASADQSGVPYKNTIVNSVRQHLFGDPNVSSYQNALSTMRTEYARVISLATGATGITDAAMKNGQDLFPDGLAPEQFEANAAVAAKEMAARTGSMHAQIAQAKKTMHTPAGTEPAPGSSGTAAPISLDQYLTGKGF